MNDKHQAYYKCGHCKKKTPIADEDLQSYIDGPNPKMLSMHPICTCGHFSYASGIVFKAELNMKDWKMSYGTIQEQQTTKGEE